MHKRRSNNGKKKRSAFWEIKDLIQSFYITRVPSYGNSFFFTIGMYLMELFAILAASGMVMLVFGPFWWDTTSIGTFVRSVHLWAAEAFVTLILLHVFVNFSTSAFRKKKLVWVIGAVILLLVFLQYAFGVAIEGDFVYQWNAKSAADLWNGLGLGFWLNPLNYGAVFGWHVAIVPIVLIALLFLHVMLNVKKGLNTPYRKDIPYKMVKADHRKIFRRMIYVAIIILLFAAFFRAPYIAPLTITSVAQHAPNVVALTLLSEFTNTSGTATYLDTIQPYTFSTSKVYVTYPYSVYINASGGQNRITQFFGENATTRNETLTAAFAYFKANGSIENGLNSTNPMISSISVLTRTAQTGIYGPVLQSEQTSGLDQTYTLRFLADTGILDKTAVADGLQINQWGLLKLSSSWWPPGSYWLLPYNVMEGVFPNGTDLEDGLVALAFFVVFLLFPFIPYLNKLPDKLKMYKIFWNRFTIPELRKKRK